MHLPSTLENNEAAIQPENTRDLRIAIISDAAPERNGVGAYYFDMVEHLRDHVEQVDLISPHYASRAWHGAITFPMPGDATQKICLPPVRRINRHIKQMAPQIIIVPTPGPYGMLAIPLAKRLNAKLIVGFHTHYEKLTGLYWNRILGSVTRSYFNVCNHLLFRHSDLVLANSQDMADIATAMGAPQIRLMGTPIPRLYLDKPTNPLPQKLTTVLFAGRLAAEKNIESLVAAAEQLPGLQFRVAGEGPLRSFIEKRSKQLANLTYLGWLTRTQLLGVLDEADMLILPSHVESFGTIALEGMARNKTVLVSAQCGLLDWPDLNRGVFNMAQNETVADAIARVASLDYGVRNRKAKLAADAARDLNAWNVKNWLTILNELRPDA